MSKDKPRQDARQELYKNCGRSPVWKEQFRKRCLERLKDSRDRHMSLRRSINSLNDLSPSDSKVDQRCNSDYESKKRRIQKHDQENVQNIDTIMKEEFDRLKDELSSKHHKTENVDLQPKVQSFVKSNSYSSTSCQERNNLSYTRDKDGDIYNSVNASLDCCFSENDLDLWYEEIYASLRAELEKVQKADEEAHLQSLQDEYVKEEEELCSAIEALCTKVTCPLCGKFNLVEQKNVISCRCGLKINIEQDYITLKNVKDNLAAGTEEHSQKCESKPTFSMDQNFGISNLLMSCRDCGFLFVIV